MVTAYTDGQVTKRSNRSKIGYHEAASMDNYQGVHAGDFVVHGLDILRGSVGTSDSDGAISQVCTICIPSDDVDPRYVAHAIRLQASSGFTRALARGVREGGADFRRWSTLAELPIPVPPKSQQVAIANYLDRETAQIDALIAKQEQLIATLRERRAATVARSVPPGFRPSDPGSRTVGSAYTVVLGKMLDSGREAPPDATERSYLRAANVQDSGLKLDSVNTMPFTYAESQRLSLQKGDLLVVEGGAVGTNWLIEEDMPDWSFQKTLNRVRTETNHSTRWLGHVIRTYRDNGYISLICNGSTISHFTAEKLRALRIPDVHPAQQESVANSIDSECAKIDALIAKAERFIELSKERRAALITAAVTGQIDVPGTAA